MNGPDLGHTVVDQKNQAAPLKPVLENQL